MSICQVESFYDSIRKYQTVAEVTKRANIEAKYLNEVCGTTASLKRYLTMYRNYLKDKIQFLQETIRSITILTMRLLLS